MPTNLVLYLRPEVPERDELVEAAWVDRALELSQAIALAEGAIVEPPSQPLVIQGAARVGKSHLLRRVERAIAERFGVVIRAKLTAERSDVRVLLAQLLDQVIEHLVAQGHAEDIAPVVHIRQRFGSLMDGAATSVDVASGDSVEMALGLALSARVASKLSFGVAGQTIATFLGLPVLEASAAIDAKVDGKRTRTHSRTMEVHYGQFAASQITRLISLAHALVASGSPSQTLFVVDDFDLLKRGIQQELDPGPLLRELCALARTPGLFVLTTVRADTYEQNKKSLFRLVQLRPFVDPAHLTEIYRKHRNLWYSDADEPFPAEFVAEVARRSEGRVGLFLELLRDIFEESGGPVVVPLDAWFEAKWSLIESTEPDRARVLMEAVRLNRSRLYVTEEVARIRNSEVLRWIFEDYSSSDAVSVNPLLASFLARLPARVED